MNNNTSNINSNESNVPEVTFIHWPLDMDDDEFRAGYPFTSSPSEAVNGQIFIQNPEKKKIINKFLQIQHKKYDAMYQSKLMIVLFNLLAHTLVNYVSKFFKIVFIYVLYISLLDVPNKITKDNKSDRLLRAEHVRITF